MSSSGTANQVPPSANRSPGLPDSGHALSGKQWLICVIASLGFAFDLYESLMIALVAGPILMALGHFTPGTRQFNLWLGLLFFLPAVAGGLVGLFGGYLTDLLGRRRVLFWSILLYGFSAFAAGFSKSLPVLLLLRCTTLIGVSVEAVAAIAWLAELFPVPKQRESVLGYTQAFYGLGGVMVSGAYYFAVSYGNIFPAIYGSHDAWRYTLLSGLIPAIPLMLFRPLLPESRIWLEKKRAGTLERPAVGKLFQPSLRKITLLMTLMLACTYAIPYGALQQTPRIVPGILAQTISSPQQIQKIVSTVFLLQELGSITGRLIFGTLVARIAGRRRLLRIFIFPALLVFPLLFFFGPKHGLAVFKCGVFLAQVLFNGLHSFWGNYLPRVFPTHLRGTGESFAMNIGGRAIGVTAALVTTQMANLIPAANAGVRLSYSAGVTATFVLAIAAAASISLREPQTGALPN